MPLKSGMVITQSTTVRPGTYRLSASSDLSTPAITIRGDNITVDFNGAVLAGGPDGADPDTFTGVGVLIDGGEKVTLKNAVTAATRSASSRATHRISTSRETTSPTTGSRGSTAARAREPARLDVVPPEREGRVAAVRRRHLPRRLDRAEIDHTTIVQGQNGLMLDAIRQRPKIWNNNFSFLSAIGIGLYRASGNTIMHNQVDWCVRGYSHGFYNRGQDSAGILIYEQSHKNIVAFNSVTHGGDGLFLWAGQTTMDTGQGGANDNLFYEQRFQPRADQRHRGDVQPQHVLSTTASRSAGTASGAATASTRGSCATRSRGTPRRSRSSTGRTTAFTENTFRRRRDRHPPLEEPDAGSELGLPEAPRHAQPRLRDLGQHASPATRPR